jgi:hypothetical protein
LVPATPAPPTAAPTAPAEPVTAPAVVAEGGLDAGTPTDVEGSSTAAPSGASAEAIPGRENGNNPEEASSMTPEDWASLARP